MGDNWLSRKVQGVVAGAGNAVGGVINAVGNGVSGAGRGVGDNVSNLTRGMGDGVRSYGNAVKDATGAKGVRAPTSKNPLGLAGAKTNAGLITAGKPKGQTSTKGTANNPLGL